MNIKRSAFTKCLSILLCTCLLLGLCQVALIRVNAASGESGVWFEKGKETVWWNWDWNHGQDGGRFAITYPNDVWTVTANFSWVNHINTQTADSANWLELDLAAQGVLEYDITSAGAPELTLVLKDGNDSRNITVGTVGTGAGTFDLENNADVQALAQDGKVTVKGLYFDFAGAEGQTIAVKDFRFAPKPVTEEVTPDWFDQDQANGWWNWDWNHGKNDEGRFFITFPENVWTLKTGADWVPQVNSNWSDSNSWVQIDLNVQNTLYYDISSELAPRLVLRLQSENGDTYVTVGQTGSGAGSYDLAGNADVQAAAQDGKVTVKGIRFEFTGSAGKTIAVKDFRFAPKPVTEEVTPDWFDQDQANGWWNWDWNHGKNDEGRFFITFPENVWTLKTGADWVPQVNSNWSDSNSWVQIDLNVQNTLYYDISSELAPRLVLRLQSENGDTYVTVGQTGSGAGSYDLAGNADVQAAAQDGKVTVKGIRFEFTGSAGKTIAVKDFRFAPKKGQPEEPQVELPPESWLLDQSASNWWSWDWNLKSGAAPQRFTVEQAADGTVTQKMLGSFLDLKYLAADQEIDVNKTPYLFVDVTAEYSYDLYLLVSGSSEGNNGVPVQRDIPAGTCKEKLDLREVLADHIHNGKISLFGFRIEPKEDPHNKTIVFRTLDIGAADAELFGARPAAPTISVDTVQPAAQVTLTVTAPEDALTVQYRAGESGIWKTYEGPLTLKKNIRVYARYVSADGYWSMSTSRQLSNIVAGHTEDVQPVQPIWFNPGEEDVCWYNWDWHHGKNDEDRFFITYPEDRWTATIGQSWVNRLETQHNDARYHLTIDLDEQNALFYKIQSEFELNVSLKVLLENGSYATVKVGTVPAGYAAGSFSLGDNSELLALSDDDNKLVVSGLIFDGFSVNPGKKFQVDRCIFDSEDAYYDGYPGQEVAVREIEPNWFSAAQVDRWTTDGLPVNDGSAGSVGIDVNNDWRYTVLDPALSTEITSGGDSVTVNLKGANHLFYQIRTTTQVKLQLAVRSQGQVLYVDVLTLDAGQHEGKVNLAEMQALSELANHDTLRVMGVRFVPVNAAAGSTVKVDRFAFNRGSAAYPPYVDEAQIEADRLAAAQVDALIRSIGTVTKDSKAAIEQARAAYEALTAAQKHYVQYYPTLTAAETAYADCVNADKLADQVDVDALLRRIAEEPGTLIDIRVETGVELPAQVLAAAKNQGCDLQVSVYERKSGALLYAVLVRTEDMTDTSHSFDARLQLEEKNLSDGTAAVWLSGGKNNMVASYVKIGLEARSAALQADTLWFYRRLEERTVEIAYGASKAGESAWFSMATGGEYLLAAQRLTVRESSSGTAAAPLTGERRPTVLPIALAVSAAALAVAGGLDIIKRRREMRHNEDQ